MKQIIEERWLTDELAIDFDFVLPWIGLRTQFCNDCSIDCHSPFLNQPLGLSPGGQPAVRQDLLNALHSSLFTRFLRLFGIASLLKSDLLHLLQRGKMS